jgi:hypothetical protein
VWNHSNQHPSTGTTSTSRSTHGTRANDPIPTLNYEYPMRIALGMLTITCKNAVRTWDDAGQWVGESAAQAIRDLNRMLRPDENPTTERGGIKFTFSGMASTDGPVLALIINEPEER